MQPVTKFIIAALTGILGFVGTYFLGKFVSRWDNEIRNTTEDNEATEGRETATQSDQNLNDQTKDLPKG
jgi:hypothetical protein